MYQWPIIDEKLTQQILSQLHRSLSDTDSSGIIGEVERSIRNYYDAQYALFLSSATGALHSLVFALNLTADDEVIVPTYTFFATFSPFAYEGIQITQCNCNQYGQIDIEHVKKSISEKTRAIICTHMWGIPSNLEELTKIAKENDLYLIEDCSHAHLATVCDKKVGTFGDVGIFSTNQKALTSGEGGFLIASNKDIFERCLLLGHYNKRCRNEIFNDEYAEYSLTGLGLKYRGNTLAAAILESQFDKIDEIKKIRTKNYDILSKAVDESKAFENIIPNYSHSPGLYVFPFLIKDQRYRELFLNWAHSQNFNYFDAPGSTKPLFDQKLFYDYGNSIRRRPQLCITKNDKKKFEKSLDFHQKILKLPLWGSTKDVHQVKQYAEIIKEFKI